MHLDRSHNNDKAFEQLFEALFDPSLAGRIGDGFYNYYGSFITNRESLHYFFMYQRRLSEVLRSEDKEIVEVGCGFGLILICQMLLGAKKATGIDTAPEMIDGFSILLEHFPELDIEPIKGDFLSTDFAEGSCDIVILNEAISHVRDTTLLLDKICSILRPQGVLFIGDENNEAYFPSRLKRRQGWKICEYGPVPERRALYGRAIDRLSFFDARKQIIKANYPLLDEESIKYLAKKTQGMYGETLKQACQELLNTGKTLQRASFPYRNPYTGEFHELGINPYKLSKELRARGFDCHYLPPPYSYLGWHTKLPPAKDFAVKSSRIIFKCPNLLFPLFSPWFYLVATKC